MKKLLFIPIAIFAFVGCETSEPNVSSVNPPPPSSTTSHVYVVGNKQSPTNSVDSFISVDGVESTLRTDYFVADVFAVGNDVYTCGNITGSSSVNKVQYTKNGIVYDIDTSGSPGSMFVTGNDVYVSGKKNNKAVYWKNGNITILNSDPLYNSYTRSIIIINNDVYVLGAQKVTSVSGNYDLGYWKNGVWTSFGPMNSYDASVESFFIKNNDIYVALSKTVEIQAGGCGNCPSAIYRNDAYIIKNGVQTLIAANASANDVFVNGADVYLCGSSNQNSPNSNATIWKNGAIVYTATNDRSSFKSLFVANNNVFAAGTAQIETVPNTNVYSNRPLSLINNVITQSTIVGGNYRAIFVSQ